jgi:hypothetical protein
MLHYFAYGANMAPSVLAKRGVQPISSEAAVVSDRGTWLCFGHRGGYATLVQRRRREAVAPPPQPAWQQPHGVLHALRAEDLQQLAQREVGYCLTHLPVQPYTHAQPCTAVAFVSSPLLRLYHPAPPRQRYHALLLEGCQHFQLDARYASWLEELDVSDGRLDAHDACPADSLAKLLAAGAVAGSAWASAHL